MAKNKLTAQPQAIEAEQAVLGSMLISKDAVRKSLQWLPSANYFYKEAHSKIYSCMIDLFDRGDPIDAISVVDQLKKKKENLKERIFFQMLKSKSLRDLMNSSLKLFRFRNQLQLVN